MRSTSSASRGSSAPQCSRRASNGSPRTGLVQPPRCLTSKPERTVFSNNPRGPCPTLRVRGSKKAGHTKITRDLTNWWRERLATLPNDNSPAPKWICTSKRVTTIRHGWLMRLTTTGREACTQAYLKTPILSAAWKRPRSWENRIIRPCRRRLTFFG